MKEKKLEKVICRICGKEMEQQIDPITKKLSPYLWKCTCTPKDKILSIG
jgi:hypothetical protein